VDLAVLRALVVRESEGRTTLLEDVALVEDGFEDVRRRARVNGVPAQGLGVKKQRGANAVAVAQGVRAELERLRPLMPDGVEIGLNFDSTRFIEESVRDIEIELALAVLLTAIVCWIFLGSLQSTLNVVLAIPMSLLGTVAIIWFFGFTLNTFTLLALALAVGIVVDDAIMVMENIFRHGEGGKDRVTAAREGTAEITFAALAATLAVVAIFVPVVFMKGVMGRFFMQFGAALAIAVLLSYVEAVTLAPARCAQLLDTSRKGRTALGRFVDRGFDRLASGYGRLLRRALARPLVVIAFGLAVLGGAVWSFTQLEGEFVPSQDQSRLMIRLQAAVGASLEETDRLFRQAEAIVNPKPEVRRAFAVVGGFGGSGVNTGIFFVTLIPPDQRSVTQAEFAAGLRRELNSIPGLRAVVQDLSQSGFTAQRGFPVEFSVRGPDWERLVEVTQGLTKKLDQSGLVVDLDTDYQVGMPELRVVPNRSRAADLGVSMEDVAGTVNALVGGVRVGKYSAGGRRIDVRLRLLASQRTRPEDLARLRVRAGNGTLVPLSALVATDERPALQAVTRRDRQRAITVFANVAPGHSQEEALARVEAITRDLPDQYSAVLGGASQAFRESFGSLLFALMLGIAVAYMVLASQFNSFLHPVTVLTVLPLSAAGAGFGLWLADQTLNVFSLIGLLLLMGIAKKNSIILVDFAAERQRAGLSAKDAMQEAGPMRLRPILMTSIATMMAALPSALSIGQGGEVRRPMSISVLGGMAVSTLLSLFVVPAFYLVADRVRGRIAALRARRRTRGAAPVEAERAT
jgi:hydrophobe/amphiphile efflux-1 (HAE1) family protein